MKCDLPDPKNPEIQTPVFEVASVSADRPRVTSLRLCFLSSRQILGFGLFGRLPLLRFHSRFGLGTFQVMFKCQAKKGSDAGISATSRLNEIPFHLGMEVVLDLEGQFEGESYGEIDRLLPAECGGFRFRVARSRHNGSPGILGNVAHELVTTCGSIRSSPRCRRGRLASFVRQHPN